MFAQEFCIHINAELQIKGVLRIVKIYVVTPLLNRLNETVLMMGHIIRFYEEIWLIITVTSSYLEH